MSRTRSGMDAGFPQRICANERAHPNSSQSGCALAGTIYAARSQLRRQEPALHADDSTLASQITSAAGSSPTRCTSWPWRACRRSTCRTPSPTMILMAMPCSSSFLTCSGSSIAFFRTSRSLVDDRRRHALGPGDAARRARDDGRIAELLHGRHVGQELGAHVVHHGQRAHLARLHARDDAADVVEGDVDVAGHDLLELRRAAVEVHDAEDGARRGLLGHQDRQVIVGQDAGGGGADRAGRLLGGVDQVLHRLVGAVRPAPR